jgi:hypothetical protein
MRFAFSSIVLRKYKVNYWLCHKCGLLQTEQPHWLNEAYCDAIAVADTGLVMRNIAISTQLSALLYLKFDPRAAYLDLAGGYGMMTRMMRDIGFDYYWDDKYCDNLLAREFESENAKRPFAALTAFEVLEHVHEPLSFIRKNMKDFACNTLIFTTKLYTGEQPPTIDWWYYAFNTGQHISFYNDKTLKTMADYLGLHYYSIHGLHIFTDRKLHMDPLLSLATSRLAPLFSLMIRRKLGALTLSDHFNLIGRSKA